MSHGVGATAIISATLQRSDNSTSWGFRLRGGVDYGSNITIERVIVGSLADRCGLRPGDIIKFISGESTSQMRHEDAHDAILRTGNLLKLELQRQAMDELRSSSAYEDEDRATASSVSWSRSGTGSKPRSPYPPVEASSSTLADSYDTRSGNAAKKEIESVPASRVGLKTTPYAQPWRQPGKLYERERPKEIDAVVDEFKQHRETSSSTPVDSGVPVAENADDAKNDANTGQEVKPAPETAASIRPSSWCPARRPSTQSKTFLILQSMLDSGEEDLKIPRPAPHWHPPVTPGYFNPVAKSEGDVEGSKPVSEKEPYLETIDDVNEQSEQPPAASPPPFLHSMSASTPTSRGQFPFAGRSVAPDQFAPPPVPVPRRSPGPRPLSLTSPLPHQPRAFRPGAAVRSSAANPASRIPVCHRCSRNIRGPFVVALDKTWCPEHFLCDKCGCDMVDMGFVETPDGHIYCEDDYGRYMAPRCHRCRQAIIGTIVKALSAEWHTDCFTCAHCNKSIAGGLFHVEDGKPYCEKDYAELFQTKCKGCDFPIEPGDRWVEAAGDNYHVTCFACTTCQCSLANRGFVMRNGKPYCTPHSRGL